MEALKYKVITTAKQYEKYCGQLETLVFSDKKSKEAKDEIALLTLLIRTWDDEHRNFNELDPVELLHALMAEHELKSKDLVELLGVTKGYVSGILSYKKGLSKDVIRKLSARFKISQDAFNRPYRLIGVVKKVA